jgi:hypothetical protein
MVNMTVYLFIFSGLDAFYRQGETLNPSLPSTGTGRAKPTANPHTNSSGRLGADRDGPNRRAKSLKTNKYHKQGGH